MAKPSMVFISSENDSQGKDDSLKIQRLMDDLAKHPSNESIYFMWFDDELPTFDSYCMISWFGDKPYEGKRIRHYETSEIELSDVPMTLAAIILNAEQSKYGKYELDNPDMIELTPWTEDSGLQDYASYELFFQEQATQSKYLQCINDLRTLIEKGEIFKEPMGEILSCAIVFNAEQAQAIIKAFANWTNLPDKLK